MTDTLLDSTYCPIPTPKPEDFRENREAIEREKKSGIVNRTRNLLRDLGRSVGIGKEELPKQEARLHIDELRLKTLPPLVRKHMLAKQQIMQSCIENPELEKEIALVEDPRGNIYEVALDFTTKFETTNPKQEIQQVRTLATGQVLTFDSIGGKNGYNTEYRVTAQHGDKAERWNLLAVRFGKMSNMFYHRQHELKMGEAKLVEARDALKAEIKELNLKFLELSHEKTLLQKALANPKKTPVKKQPAGKANPKQKAPQKGMDHGEQIQRIASIDSRLPVIHVSLNEKTMLIAAVMERLDKTSAEIKVLPSVSGMRDSGAYIPYSNLRRPDENGNLSPAREALALEVEKVGLRSLKESVSRTWAAPDIVKYPTNLKTKSGEALGLSEAFPYQVGMVLAIVERMGFLEYASEYNPTKHSGKVKDMAVLRPIMDAQIEKALNNLGMNQEGAFDFIRSPAGARGMGQMMPNTHRNFVNQYGSNPDDLLGSKKYESRYIFASTTQKHSLRFMQVHLFDEARYLPVEIRDNWQKLISNPKTRSGLFGLLAAGYNGDIGRVKAEVGIPSGPGSMKEALKTPKPAPAHGTKAKKTFTKLVAPDADNSTEEIFRNLQKMLETEQLIKRLDGNIETTTYVMKFDYVWKYLEKKFPQEFGVAR